MLLQYPKLVFQVADWLFQRLAMVFQLVQLIWQIKHHISVHILSPLHKLHLLHFNHFQPFSINPINELIVHHYLGYWGLWSLCLLLYGYWLFLLVRSHCASELNNLLFLFLYERVDLLLKQISFFCKLPRLIWILGRLHVWGVVLVLTELESNSALPLLLQVLRELDNPFAQPNQIDSLAFWLLHVLIQFR